jgi:hypothetical protein
MDPVEPMSLSELKRITNLTVSVTPMAILNEFSIFGCRYTRAFINTSPRIDMICSESNLGPTYSIHYTIPDVEDKLEIFDGLSVNDFSFEIECPTNYVALCSHNDYRISTTFTRTVPSSIYGTSQITEEVIHWFDSEELFELNLHLQNINLKEAESNQNIT